jgi:two-component system, OmpR family, response regulator CpxR
MRPKKTILCVDDNDQHLSIRKFMLETRGYNVITCTNGKDAIEAFGKGGVDLILCDLMMPEMNGAEVVKMIKASSPETPAIIFSGKIKIYDKDLHADVFLPKGMYAPTELLERIRLLTIRKRGPKKSRVLATPATTEPVTTAVAASA